MKGSGPVARMFEFEIPAELMPVLLREAERTGQTTGEYLRAILLNDPECRERLGLRPLG